MQDKTATAAPAPWWKRIGWLVIIWSASVLGCSWSPRCSAC